MPAVVILGVSKPLLVLVISSCADASGVLVPMPMLCPKEVCGIVIEGKAKQKNKKEVDLNIFIIRSVFSS
jgi:hypothetical protein